MLMGMIANILGYSVIESEALKLHAKLWSETGGASGPKAEKNERMQVQEFQDDCDLELVLGGQPSAVSMQWTA